MSEITEEQWRHAIDRVDRSIEIYKYWLGDPQVMVGPALDLVFRPLLRRYNAGERTRALYDEMMGVE